MVKTHNLSKSFQGRQVVRGLSFEAPDGAITGLLGANGAGKTTTLRMICGVLQADSGSVAVDGASDARERQQRVGALLDHIGLYSRLTVRENMAYFGRLRGMSTEILQERIEHLIGVLGLDAIADRRTAGFSQGERMKTALGRALLHSPTNVVLDEPTNGLDIPTIRSLRDLLRRLRDAGTCVVFNGHLWHGGTTNNTDRPRHALHAAFLRREHPQQTVQRDYLRPETIRQLSSAQRYLLDV